ncbi:hypothetical protein [Lacticaseibacillus suihuaensis]
MTNLWVAHREIPVTLTYQGLAWPTSIAPGVVFTTAAQEALEAPQHILTPWAGSAEVTWQKLAAGARLVDSQRFLAQPCWIYPHWQLLRPLGAKVGGVKPRLLPSGAVIEIQQARRLDQELYLYVIRAAEQELTVKLLVSEFNARAKPLGPPGL